MKRNLWRLCVLCVTMPISSKTLERNGNWDTKAHWKGWKVTYALASEGKRVSARGEIRFPKNQDVGFPKQARSRCVLPSQNRRIQAKQARLWKIVRLAKEIEPRRQGNGTHTFLDNQMKLTDRHTKRMRDDTARKAKTLDNLIKFVSVQSVGGYYYLIMGKGVKRIGQELYEDLLRWGVEEDD